MQALLIYVLGNKNHLKNINDQNFEHFMRGYDKGELRQRISGIKIQDAQHPKINMISNLSDQYKRYK